MSEPARHPPKCSTAIEKCITGYGQQSQKTGQASAPTVEQNQVTVDAMQPLQLCSTAQNVGTVNIGAATSQSLIPSFSTTLTTPLASLLSSIVPHITLPSLLQSYTLQTCASSNNTPSTSHNMQPKPGTVKSNQPFFITVLNNRIKKCSGCSMLFRECRAGSEPDYILGHMKRDWFPQNGQWQLGKLHPNPDILYLICRISTGLLIWCFLLLF